MPFSSAVLTGGNTQAVPVTGQVLHSATRPDRPSRAPTRALASVATVDLPPLIVDRARRYRARLSSTDTELTTASLDELDLAGTGVVIDQAGSIVLAVAVLEGGQAAAEHRLNLIREALPLGAELWLIERANPIRSESGTARLLERLRIGRFSSGVVPRDVIEAMRSSRWTICAVERFTVEDADGTPTHWIDAIGRDLAAEGNASRSF